MTKNLKRLFIKNHLGQPKVAAYIQKSGKEGFNYKIIIRKDIYRIAKFNKEFDKYIFFKEIDDIKDMFYKETIEGEDYTFFKDVESKSKEELDNIKKLKESLNVYVKENEELIKIGCLKKKEHLKNNRVYFHLFKSAQRTYQFHKKTYKLSYRDFQSFSNILDKTVVNDETKLLLKKEYYVV